MRSLIISIVLLFLAVSFSSCMVVAAMFGISHPHEISEKKLQRKIDKYHLNTFQHLNITEVGFWSFFEIVRSKEIPHGIHDMFIFKDGKMIYPEWYMEKCPIYRYAFVASLRDSSTSYLTIDSVRLQDFINKQSIVEYDAFVETDTSDFVILLHWGDFAGFANKFHTTKAVPELKNAIDSGVSASVYFVNLDVKEDWSVRKIRYNLKPDSVNNFIFIREDKYKKD